MNFFISHAHEEKDLAQLWKDIFGQVAPQINIWFSSDDDPQGGIQPGKWRTENRERLEQADIVIPILTPESVGNPWIIYECAYAMGKDGGTEKTIVPVVYEPDYMSLPGPLQEYQTYSGEEKTEVIKMVERLALRSSKGKAVNETSLGHAVSDYFKELQEYQLKHIEEALFHGDFHTRDTARKMAGTWWGKWTEYEENGDETIWQIDELKILHRNDRDRIRIVGSGGKAEKVGGRENPYPMEGVISSKGFVALSYWSAKEDPICGTVLLKLKGGNRLMEGKWQGHTTKDMVNDDLSLTGGRVVLGRDRAQIEDYWGIQPTGKFSDTSF